MAMYLIFKVIFDQRITSNNLLRLSHGCYDYPNYFPGFQIFFESVIIIGRQKRLL